uniref:Uncharacterized protein n=1 Tax=Rhodopseudomonas palustris (strain BisA53) TaxID=316055 RepID=Q07QQ9_RHOP5
MPHSPFLRRIKQMFSAPGAYVRSLKDGLKGRRLIVPARPMTDQELARAIREFLAASGSDRTRRPLGDGSEGN